MEELNVVAEIKIYVEDPSAMQAVKDSVGNIAKVQSFREEELGFGIKVLKAVLLLPDAGMEEVEEKIKSIDKVSQVEVESVSRV